MNEYIGIVSLAIILIVYVIFLKERLIKWEERNSIEKSYSIRIIVVLIVGIILLICQRINSQ